MGSQRIGILSEQDRNLGQLQPGFARVVAIIQSPQMIFPGQETGAKLIFSSPPPPTQILKQIQTKTPGENSP
jgi:hypothetical protein